MILPEKTTRTRKTLKKEKLLHQLIVVAIFASYPSFSAQIFNKFLKSIDINIV